MSVGRIAAEFFQGASLTQQVPILVELDLDFLQPLLIGVCRGTMLIEALLFRHQFPNVVEHRPVGRLYLSGGMFVCHLQFSEHTPPQMSAAGRHHKMVISVITLRFRSLSTWGWRQAPPCGCAPEYGAPGSGRHRH